MNSQAAQSAAPEQRYRPEPRAPLPELAFVVAPRQNLFFVELAEAFRAEAESLGARASLHVGNFPPPRPDLIYVLLSPHEYFTLMHGRVGPPREALRRTVFICCEQPGTSFFDENLALAPLSGAIFDINRVAVDEFARNGLVARHVQLGWTPTWDHSAERERDIDVLFMGCVSDRRQRAIAGYARTLSRRRVRLVLSDNARPNWMASEGFLSGADKWDLLNRSKVLINVHQGETPYFEWLRIVQAMANGVVVVSEHSTDSAPLVPGRHFLSGGVESLGVLAQHLLDDVARWENLHTEAYRFVREALPLRRSITEILDSAAVLARAEPLPATDHPFFTQPPADPAHMRVFREPTQQASSSDDDPTSADLRRAAKSLLLEMNQVKRQLSSIQLELRDGRPPPRIEFVRSSRARAGARPRVSVIMALYNYEEHVVDALESLKSSDVDTWEVIIVDDGSSDRSLEVARKWIARHERDAALLLRHPVNLGLGPTRNDALDWARGEFSFILDADNEVYPHCLSRLVEALDEELDAAFAYGILERFTAGQPVGLLNTFPWEPRRLRTGNYIDAMAMLRTRVVRNELGGFARDRRLHGLEDYELWCRVAEAGRRAAFVPEIVGRYRATRHSMQAVTNVSMTEAVSLVIEGSPRLMAGMRPPAA